MVRPGGHPFSPDPPKGSRPRDLSGHRTLVCTTRDPEPSDTPPDQKRRDSCPENLGHTYVEWHGEWRAHSFWCLFVSTWMYSLVRLVRWRGFRPNRFLRKLKDRGTTPVLTVNEGLKVLVLAVFVLVLVISIYIKKGLLLNKRAGDETRQ